jgi:predicted AlkP superfamily pyrophosphatase or phosphodiesterase
MAMAPDLSAAEIYLGPLGRSTGFPAEWVRTLDEKIGFWPGVPDSTAFGAETSRPELFLEQTDRLVDVLTRAALLAVARADWDLLLMYQPEIDETGHEFLLVDPRQPRFTTERSERFLGFVERSYALADRSLDAIQKALRSDDTLFVTGDHGMTPIWAEISIIDLFREAGLVRLDADREILSSSPLLPVPASGIVHIYRNPSAAPDVIDRAEQLVRSFRVAGESPFDRIVRREDANDLGLRRPESGDLIVLARPGYQFARKARADGALVGERADYGGHGYRNVYPEIDATLFAAGPGIPHEVVDSIGSWEIAARVAKALGISPPMDAVALPGERSAPHRPAARRDSLDRGPDRSLRSRSRNAKLLGYFAETHRDATGAEKTVATDTSGSR